MFAYCFKCRRKKENLNKGGEEVISPEYRGHILWINHFTDFFFLVFIHIVNCWFVGSFYRVFVLVHKISLLS